MSLTILIVFMMSWFFSMTWFTCNVTYHFDCLHDVWVLLQHDLVYRQCHLPFWLSSWCLGSSAWLGLQAMSLTILIVLMMPGFFFSMTWFTGNVTYQIVSMSWFFSINLVYRQCHLPFWLSSWCLGSSLAWLGYRQCHLPFWLSSWCLGSSLAWLGLQAMSLTILIVFKMSGFFFSMTWLQAMSLTILIVFKMSGFFFSMTWLQAMSLTILIVFMMSGFFSLTWFTGNVTYHFDCLHDVLILQHDLVYRQCHLPFWLSSWCLGSSLAWLGYRQCHLPFWLSSWCLGSLAWLGLQAMSLTILIVFMMSWFFSMTWFTGNVTYHFDCLHDVWVLLQHDLVYRQCHLQF